MLSVSSEHSFNLTLKSRKLTVQLEILYVNFKWNESLRMKLIELFFSVSPYKIYIVNITQPKERF